MNRSLLPALFLPLCLLLGGAAWAEVQTKAIEYKDGDVSLRGYLAWDDSIQGPRPGVMVVHEWWGLNDYARKRAEQLAGMGYAAFAVDMYGDDKVTEHGKQAQEWMQQITANMEAWRRRALLALDLLRKQEQVNPQKVAAIGYCFGGATVMQMAYSGADLAGVVSFHGSLPPATPEDLGRIKARILVEHGAADGFVPAERIAKFQEALSQAGADWRMVINGGAKHSFTNPGADAYGIDGLAYNAEADRRSWQDMQDFFAEIFGGG
jgi:dienelactone hydrolase